MVRDGRIDTLIVALTDMQGRLMGKRVQAQAFLDGVIDHGAHFCTYLLGTDMEMNTPDGFALMNWETGYGDWVARPVWDTLRVLPWLERTALVLGDTIDDETEEEIPVSPAHHPEAPGRRAAAERGFAIKAGSEFEYYLLRDTYDAGQRQGRRPCPSGSATTTRTTTCSRRPRREPIHRLLRNQMTEARIPDRVQQGRGRARPARGQHPLRPRPGVGRPERHLQARRQGDRLPQRPRPDLHGQARRIAGPARPATCT